MANLAIDLDLEAVQYDGSWYTRDELAQKIKAQLEAGDYAISRPSQALELLTSQLASSRMLSFKVSQELGDALNALAARQNKSASSILRDALQAALNGSRDLVGRRPTDPEVPVVAGPVAPPLGTPAAASVAGPPPIPANAAPPGLHPAPIAGPGALRAAGAAAPIVEPKVIIDSSVSPEEAAAAVDLKPKKKEESDVERRWFGG